MTFAIGTQLGPLAGFGSAGVFIFGLLEWRRAKKGLVPFPSLNLALALVLATSIGALFGLSVTAFLEPENDARWMFSPVTAFFFCGLASFSINLGLLLPCWTFSLIVGAVWEDQGKQKGRDGKTNGIAPSSLAREEDNDMN